MLRVVGLIALYLMVLLPAAYYGYKLCNSIENSFTVPDIPPRR
jgi:hypothetical protein